MRPKEIKEENIVDTTGDYKLNFVRLIVLIICLYYTSSAFGRLIYQFLERTLTFIRLDYPTFFTYGYKSTVIIPSIRYSILLMIIGALFFFRKKVASNAPIEKSKYFFL